MHEIAEKVLKRLKFTCAVPENIRRGHGVVSASFTLANPLS
jgi:hypothetical protein